MTLDVLQAVFEDLSLEESSGKQRLVPYDDKTGKDIHPGDTVQGNITIGDGINLSSGISADEAAYLKMGRLKRAMVQLRRELSWLDKCPDEVQRGLLDLSYNEGAAHMIACNPRMIACAQAGDYGGMARELLDGPYKTQVGSRAQRIANRFLSCAVPIGEREDA